MRTDKSSLIVIGALMAVLYCGILIYYFLDISGSLRGAKTIGPSLTLLGLGAVGLLFCIPLVMKLVGTVSGSRSPGSGPDVSDDDSGFDADAAIARHTAQRPAKAAPVSAAPIFKGGGPARRQSFGRRNG